MYALVVRFNDAGAETRNHPAAIANINDVEKGISIMPTWGLQFTARAPLFPAFRLGRLATVDDHKASPLA